MLKVLCGLLTGGLFLAWASMAQADETANAIIEKAIKAHGGAANLDKLKVRQERTKTTATADGQTATASWDSLVQLPDRRRITHEFDLRGQKRTNIYVIHGDKGWGNIGGRTGEYKGDQLKFRTEQWLYHDSVLTLTPLLKDQGLTLSVLGEMKVNDRPALGVKVTAKDYGDVSLYFDKETGLLAKSEFTRNVDSKDMVVTTVYSDYKETAGLKWPRKKVEYRDGKQFQEIGITELKFLDKIDDSEFTKP